MIGVIDYGVGNIEAFLNCFNKMGVNAQKANDVRTIKRSSHLILPGVGHFSRAMSMLRNAQFISTLEHMVFQNGVPLVGVCVGMQMLSDYSEEGKEKGLGWIPGEVLNMNNVRCPSSIRLPHMGWNNVNITKSTPLLTSIDPENNQFYFLHSFYFKPKDKGYILATTKYGFEFASIISNSNIYGMQCHPEKSHDWGKNVLQNFSRL